MFQSVATIIARQASVPVDSLSPDTRVLHDLGIWGDDVDGLLSALDALKPIDWSGFRFDDYFYGEPHLFNWPGAPLTKKGLRESSKQPLTVGMLVSVVERGRWGANAAAV